MITALSVGEISQCIYRIRGQQVMLDSDLAKFYEVPPKRLNEQVRRNSNRFPPDFMFEILQDEYDSLRSQIATLNTGSRSHRKYLPLVFTEQGVAMVSTVLKSDRAVEINIAIMRAFVQFRQTSGGISNLTHKLERLEEQLDDMKYENTRQTKILLDALDKMAIEISYYKGASPESSVALSSLTLGDSRRESPDPFDVIVTAVARYYRLSTQDLRSLSRIKTVTLPRHIAMYLARKQSGSSFREIGVYFRRKDHTTILHACRKIEAAIVQDMKIRNAAKSIQDDLIKFPT